MEASRKGEVETAKLLLEEGADPDQENNVNHLPLRRPSNHFFLYLQEKWTALMAAANNGRGEIVDILLRRKANPNKQDFVCVLIICRVNLMVLCQL